MHKFQKNIFGLVVCFGIALPAWIVGHWLPLIGAPVFAIIFGMLLSKFVANYEKATFGIALTAKYVLQLAVVLLGFGLNLGQVMSVGAKSLPIILGTISTALLVAFALKKWLKIDSHTAILVGVGSSICGGSAIAATAPVIKAKSDEVVKAISVIFLFNILAALIFPSLGEWLHLSNDGFAIFAGTAVNDTSSVTATATAWDAVHQSNTLDGATIVKLTRTLAIIPITLALSFYQSYQATKSGQDGQSTFSFRRAFPMFLLYFILASVVTTLANAAQLDTQIFDVLKQLSKFFIVMAMGAIGLNTDLIRLVRTGGKAIGLGAACWIAITIMSLTIQHLMGTW